MTDGDERPGPWRVSDTTRRLNVTGHLFAWKDNQPVIMRMPGTDDLFLAVYSTVEKLHAIHGGIGYTIKRIDDGFEFLDSLPVETPDGHLLRVIVDPYYTPRRTVRFTEVLAHNGKTRSPESYEPTKKVFDDPTIHGQEPLVETEVGGQGDEPVVFIIHIPRQ
jgi:hypothetical protein